MATAAEIAKDALREGNIIALATDLTADEEAEAILLLNRVLTSLFGFELGEFAFDWPVPPSTTSPVKANFPLFPRDIDLPSDVFPYPPNNVRILLNLAADQKIYLPQQPNDGAKWIFINVGDATSFNLTVDGNGRLVKSLATITETPGSLDQQTLFYRADLGDWILIETLIASSESPLPELYDDLLALAVFIRIAPRYGRSVSKESVAAFARLMTRLKTQYRQEMPKGSGAPIDFLTPASSRLRTSFNTGRITS